MVTRSARLYLERLGAVSATSAVIGMMTESGDGEFADTLLRDETNVGAFARLVFQRLSGGISRDNLSSLG